MARIEWYSVDAKSGCWNCNLAAAKDGYCQKWNGKRLVPAHRFTYEQYKGKIPAGFEIDHLCRNVKCVNPEHLEPVSKTENVRRSSVTKLDKEKVLKIKNLYQNGNKQKDIGNMFGIGQDEVSRIIHGLRWKLI